MRRTLLALAFVSLAGLAGLSGVTAAQQPPAVAGARPTCVAVTFAARYSGYGYNHLVTIHDGCPTAVACTVSTDVSPTPTQLTVARNASQTVTTFVGSPARVFVPTVTCTPSH